jgi:hypothetical protein
LRSEQCALRRRNYARVLTFLYSNSLQHGRVVMPRAALRSRRAVDENRRKT